MDINNLSIGLINAKADLNNGKLKCSFSRMKTMSNIANYFDLSKESYFILTAYGELNSQGKYYRKRINKLIHKLKNTLLNFRKFKLSSKQIYEQCSVFF